MSKWSEVVENGLKQDLGITGIQCTSYVQTLINRAYGEWCTCMPTGDPLEWITNPESRNRIEKYYVIINDVTKAKKYDIAIYVPYNVFDHSGVLLEDYNPNHINMLSANKDGDRTVRAWAHHSYNMKYILRPKEHILPEIHFDLLKGNKNSITVGGWAKDIKNPDKAVSVHVYVIDTKGAKTKIADFLAYQPREDVGNHSFCYTINTDLIGEQQIVLAAIDTVDPVHKHTWSEVNDCYIDFDVNVGDTIEFDVSCLRPYNNYIFLDVKTGEKKFTDGTVTDQHEGKVVDVSYFKDPRYKNFNYLVRTSNTYVFVAKEDILKVKYNK